VALATWLDSSAVSRITASAMLLTTNADPDGRLDVPLNRPVTRDGGTYLFHNVWTIGGRYGFAPSMMATLRRTIAIYDLVHIHWLFNFACIAAARAALGAGVPFVIQPHGSLDPHLRKKNRLIKRMYMATVGRPLFRDAAAVVFDAAEEQRLASYRPRRPEWIMPAGIDGSRFEGPACPRHVPGGVPHRHGPFLLFVGRQAARRGRIC
jgi:glycosyltransferase involved in cell wall biosynthesis